MTIEFNNVTPAPLAGVISSTTDIWQCTCAFEAAKRYRVVAPSGKGKSTFIHYIYGLRFDFTGKVRLNGVESSHFHANEWAEIRQDKISIVYQDLRLFLQLTALQNIQVKSALYPGNFDDRIHAMAEALQVSHLLNNKAHTLSYGERQRIAIIRSLIQPFEWILLDEPFSHLDLENSKRAATLIDSAVRERNAGLIVTSLGQDNQFNYDKEYQL
ncbi:ATP-binding cassette domain-containing protein [Pseudochryseolinea flava]|uniref:ABC transporter n=1 Tax=Pseudochryseolinea flava TaxID=2059302 RepID=A0A364XW08_9BACT|nr:ATP-binding cassette domain-containing protein [Pseudochryseolinea flava]RAV98505.1 ABC transporter [Pseudochryseolinea flava]